MAKLLFLSAYQLPLYDRARRLRRRAAGRDRAPRRARSRPTTSTTRALWTMRLGDGTEESHRRMQAAVDELWPYTHELFAADPAAPVDPATLRPAFDDGRRAGAGRGDADPAGRRLGAGRRPGRRAHRAPGLPARRDAGAAPRPPGSDVVTAPRHDGGAAVAAVRGPGDPGAHHRRAGHPARRSTDRDRRPGHRHDHPDLHRLPGDGRDPGRHPPRARRGRPPRGRGPHRAVSPPGPPTGSPRRAGRSSPPPGSPRRPRCRAGRRRAADARRCAARAAARRTPRSCRRFGSTACKALWRCRSCREPFDHVKAL